MRSYIQKSLRKSHLFCLILLLSFSNVDAGVIKTISLPFSSNWKDIAWDGQNVWAAKVDISGADRYAIDPISGAVVASADTGANNHNALTWDGTHFRTVSYLYLAGRGTYGSPSDIQPDYIQKRATDGTFVSSFEAPYSSDSVARGMTWDGAQVWVSDVKHRSVVQVHPETGAVLSTFASPGINPLGMAWDGTHLWLADNVDDLLYRMDILGNVVATLPSPGPSPFGLTFDGDYLWVLDDSTDELYQLDISQVVPAPPSLLLLGFGLPMLAVRKRKREEKRKRGQAQY